MSRRMRRTVLLGAIGATLLRGLGAAALAEDFPTHPIRMVVGVSAGGPTDSHARLVSAKLSEMLGQTVVVENHSGAGGNIAFDLVAKSAPNGYTLAFVEPSLAANRSLYRSLSYDVLRDFTPVSLAVRGPTLLVVFPGLAAETLGEFVALARREPGRLTYGSAGTGTPPHLNAEVFKAAAHLDIVHVPYKGAAPAVTDMVAGRIDMMFLNIGAAKAQIEIGKLRALAVTGTARTAVLPDVPNFGEAGMPLPDLDAGSWWGVVAPAGLPADILMTLNRGLRDALTAPDTQAKLTALNLTAAPSSPEAFAALIRDETRRWAEVIKRANIAAAE